MNLDRQLAIQYLRASPRSPWRWAENGAVLVWKDGSTIAFREEVLKIIEWLGPSGLPSFGAIVFLLAAGRGKVCDVSDIIVETKTATGSGEKATFLRSTREQLKLQMGAALDQLRKVSQLPEDLRNGIKARCVLAEAVFEPARAERHSSAAAVLRGFSEPIDDKELLDSDADRAEGDGGCIRQIHIVAEGLKTHTAESLSLRMRTGLDALPREIDVNLPSTERARRLIEELSRDRELGVVARAARELVAAVRLPRRLAEREELAIAGVADITNRGPLDRLLLSELAHDDLILSVRVALNEALYLRREPPMREPPGTLALLLDSGVRLWGVPRVLAAAVALALVATDKHRSEIRCWRAHGKQIEPVDLLTRGGLTQHLGALETSAHPGESLAAFTATFGTGEHHQSVLITHRDALEDSDLRQILASPAVQPGFIAAVDRAGRFEIHALPLSRRPPICEADLDLAALLENPTGVSPIQQELNLNPDLPAIFSANPFPFLLPLAGKLDDWTMAPDGYIYVMLSDRRLARYRDACVGASVVGSELPHGKTIWMECVDGTVHLVKLGSNQRPARLISCRLDNGLVRVFDLATGSDVLAVYRYGMVILLMQRHDVRAYSLEDGRMLFRILNPHTWMHGRFVRGKDHFHFAVWDGSTIKFERVSLPSAQETSTVALVFDREGLEGPWMVNDSGIIISTLGGKFYELPVPTARNLGTGGFAVSRNGHRVCSLGIPKASKLIDLRTGRAEHLLGTTALTRMDPGPRLPQWNLYRIIESIAKLPDGIAICGRKNYWRRIVLDGQNTIRILDLPANQVNLLSHRVVFGESRPVPGRGNSLQQARWEKGSLAWLDSRGLLHLKSHDRNVAEISLVLSSTEVAGWTSDGSICGPGFFFDGKLASDARAVFGYVLQFLGNL